MTDTKPDDATIDSLLKRFSALKTMMSLEEVALLLRKGELHPEHEGRYFVAVSLCEAETIRRILHIRKKKNPERLFPSASTEVALRFSPMTAPNAPLAGDDGVIFDASRG